MLLEICSFSKTNSNNCFIDGVRGHALLTTFCTNYIICYTFCVFEDTCQTLESYVLPK